jgi:hypothetical protein
MTGRTADTTSRRTSAARRLIAALAVIAALATAAAPTASATPPEAPGCRYVVAAPPGVSGNFLLIERGESVGLRRVGEGVGVFKLHGAGPEVECEGRAATVHDIDKILFRPPGAAHQLTIEESAGPLAPGATPEPGGDEIEIYARFPKRRPGPISLNFPRVRVVGTDGPEQLRIGRVGRDRTGINLDAAADGAHPDADVIAYSVSPARYILEGLGGNDRLDSSGTAPEFDGPLPEGSVTLAGGPGDDSIEAVDNERERILCGSGFDHIGVDELDEWSSTECERAHGPGAH